MSLNKGSIKLSKGQLDVHSYNREIDYPSWLFMLETTIFEERKLQTFSGKHCILFRHYKYSLKI